MWYCWGQTEKEVSWMAPMFLAWKLALALISFIKKEISGVVIKSFFHIS